MNLKNICWIFNFHQLSIRHNYLFVGKRSKPSNVHMTATSTVGMPIFVVIITQLLRQMDISQVNWHNQMECKLNIKVKWLPKSIITLWSLLHRDNNIENALFKQTAKKLLYNNIAGLTFLSFGIFVFNALSKMVNFSNHDCSKVFLWLLKLRLDRFLIKLWFLNFRLS